MAVYNFIFVLYAKVGAAMMLFLATAIGCAYSPARALADEPVPLGGNVYCGPQCVKRVLRYFDINVDLPDLVREIQWPDVYSGSSMDALRSALESRGLLTRAVTIPKTVDIDWTHPVIVHLRRKNEEHFVVWLPEGVDSTSPVVWDSSLGLLGSGDALPAFNALRTGPVLLTSDRAIADAPQMVRRADWIFLGGDLCIVTAIGLVIAYVVHLKRRAADAK